MAGKIQSLVLSLRETQQLQSEQLHFTRQLIDALPLPVFVRDANGAYIEVNRAWQRLFHPPTSVGTAPASPAYPPELAPGNSTRIAQAQNNEIRIFPANHEPPRDMAYYEAPFTTTRGTLAGTIGTLVDVTERKRAQEALRTEKERAEVTLASIGDGVISTDLAGNIETINEAAQLMTGFTADQAVGRQLDDVFRLYEELASRSAGSASWRETVPGALQQAAQEVLIHRSGERYAIEYTASAIRKADGTAVGCVLVFRDVTETRKARPAHGPVQPRRAGRTAHPRHLRCASKGFAAGRLRAGPGLLPGGERHARASRG
jgi:PAS domain S-box-containing protein